MQRKIVTSFSRAGYEKYGKIFLESYRDVGNDVPLEVYSENEFEVPIGGDRLNFARKLFPVKNVCYGTTMAHGMGNYRYQAARFAWKPQALAQSLKRKQANWTIWIDGDVEFKKKFDEEFWEQTTNQNNLFSYIGRDISWDHSECGFVAYATGHPVPIRFIEDLWDMYSTGKVFRLREWHDSYVFDWLAAKKYEAWGPYFMNIAKGINSQHPWPDTILGEYAVHHKGPVAKGVRYDSVVGEKASRRDS